MNSLVCLLFLLQNPLHNQTKTINLQKPLAIEKITLQKLDPIDLAHLAYILNLSLIHI